MPLSPPGRHSRPYDTAQPPSDYIDESCTAREVIDTLKNLTFTNGQASLQLDRHAAKYLIASVSARCGNRT